MVDVRNYDFKYITDKTVKPEESFINLYVDKEFKSENTIKSTHRMCRILDVKYKKADLSEVMTKLCHKTPNCFATPCTSTGSEEIQSSV